MKMHRHHLFIIVQYVIDYNVKTPRLSQKSFLQSSTNLFLSLSYKKKLYTLYLLIFIFLSFLWAVKRKFGSFPNVSVYILLYSIFHLPHLQLNFKECRLKPLALWQFISSFLPFS